jgi:hypothetical protein
MNTNATKENNQDLEIRDIRQQPFIWIDKIILTQYMEHIGAIGLALYCALVRYANEENKCWPSYNTLAQQLKIGRSTAIEYMSLLVRYRLIGVEKRKNADGVNHTNIYLLLAVKPIDQIEIGEPNEKQPSPPKQPPLVQQADYPSPPNRPSLVQQVDYPSPPNRPKQDLKEQDKDNNNNITISQRDSLTLNERESNKNKINFSSFSEEESKQTDTIKENLLSETETNSSRPVQKQNEQKDTSQQKLNQLEADKLTVFQHWKEKMSVRGECSMSKGDSYHKFITARMKEGLTAKELCLAIDGCTKSHFHMGFNDRGKAFNDLTTILKSKSQVEMFIAIATAENKPVKKDDPLPVKPAIETEEERKARLMRLARMV